MKVNIRNDSVVVEGYVNAIERDSKTLRDRMGQFIERICKGAFKKAIKKNNNIRVLLNHNWGRELGNTKDGSLELTEDNIGLHARATITDPEVMDKAKKGDLVGWSFGFEDAPGGVETREIDGIRHRFVKDMDLYEVSILDRSKRPAYEGTLLAARSDDEEPYNCGEAFYSDVEVVNLIEEREEIKPVEEIQEQPKVIDYSEYEKIISEMKGA